MMTLNVRATRVIVESLRAKKRDRIKKSECKPGFGRWAAGRETEVISVSSNQGAGYQFSMYVGRN